MHNFAQVANKVVELVMMKGGCDVCCTSEADRERMERIEAGLGQTNTAVTGGDGNVAV